jgi:hypothetical protein
MQTGRYHKTRRHTLILEQLRKMGQCTQCLWLVRKLFEYGGVLDIRDERVWVLGGIISGRNRKMASIMAWWVRPENSQLNRLETRQKRTRWKHYLVFVNDEFACGGSLGSCESKRQRAEWTRVRSTCSPSTRLVWKRTTFL